MIWGLCDGLFTCIKPGQFLVSGCGDRVASRGLTGPGVGGGHPQYESYVLIDVPKTSPARVSMAPFTVVALYTT